MSAPADSNPFEYWETKYGSAGTREIYLHPPETSRPSIRSTIVPIVFILVGLWGWWFTTVGWIAWLNVAMGVLFLLRCAHTWLRGTQSQSRLVITIDERGITDYHWARYPLFIPKEEIEAIILFRWCWCPWLGIRVRDRDALLATLPGWVAWCRRRSLSEGISFAVCDTRLSWSVRKMAEEISARYGVPIGLGPGMGRDTD